MGEDEKGFAARWSKRKVAARQEAEDVDEVEEQAETDVPAIPAGDDELLTEADFDDVDFDALDKSSDYTRFIKSNVPAAIQKKALRKLWDSDSVFEVLDGMNDYDEDFTGNGLAGKIFKTAHQVGRGFITDEDVKSPEGESEETAEETTEEIAECIEEQDEEAQETVAGADTTETEEPPSSTT